MTTRVRRSEQRRRRVRSVIRYVNPSVTSTRRRVRSVIPLSLSLLHYSRSFSLSSLLSEAAATMDKGKKASPEEEHPRKAFGWAARDSSGVLSPFTFSRR
ncbi:hypothetical protein GW17_00033062 [Ensete ventricosum]|nr:hypothetical protein GW17_00033062 [Ensete ventricosum]